MENNYTISLSVGMVSLQSSYTCFGAQNGEKRTIVLFNGQLYAGDGSRRVNLPITSDSTITAKWTNENGAHYLEGFRNEESVGKVHITGSFSDMSYGILFVHGGEGVVPISCQMKQCSIKTGNNALLDLIPVRVGNVGYMYDNVSGRLFGNAGSGSFILGPDIE